MHTYSQDRTGMKHVNVGDLIKEHKCYDGRDEDLDSNILDEDKLLDAMEVILDKAAEEGQGIVADFHVCEMFPERWFDLVLCLRTSTDVLFDRLTARGYSEKKRAGAFFKLRRLCLLYCDCFRRRIIDDVRMSFGFISFSWSVFVLAAFVLKIPIQYSTSIRHRHRHRNLRTSDMNESIAICSLSNFSIVWWFNL